MTAPSAHSTPINLALLRASPQPAACVEIPGICGIVDGSILPGYYGIEAGQSAVGDLLGWWVEGVGGGTEAVHLELSKQAARLQPGQSGLLALDWNNGNRTVLVDARLTGLLVGQTLHTTRAEIYRALIEATAFGARTIVERLREYGVAIERVVCCGGIADKNDLFMQIYADVIGQPMLVAGSKQTPALGAALSAAVTAGAAAGGFDDWREAQRAMTTLGKKRFTPRPEAQAVYNELYGLYRELHDSFGGVGDARPDFGTLMKRLLDIKGRDMTSRRPAPRARVPRQYRPGQQWPGLGHVWESVSAQSRGPRLRDQAERRAVRPAHTGSHCRHLARDRKGRQGPPAAVVRHADAPGALSRVLLRRDCAHALGIRHDVRAGEASGSMHGDDARRLFPRRRAGHTPAHAIGSRAATTSRTPGA